MKYYETDIRKYFSEKSLNPVFSEVAYTIFCEGVPAGIFLGKKEADGVLSVNMDYTTPVYRDCSVGRFLYSRLKEEGFKKVICSEVHEAHKSYIGKMGFCEENGVYVKEL